MLIFIHQLFGLFLLSYRFGPCITGIILHLLGLLLLSHRFGPCLISITGILHYFLLVIRVTIAMEVGRTKISIRDLLSLNRGSIVELDRLVGDPLDVLVNGTLIAHGEVVMVKDKFGIRLTDVVSPAERVRKLK